jgi:hypothetical protein
VFLPASPLLSRPPSTVTYLSSQGRSEDHPCISDRELGAFTVFWLGSRAGRVRFQNHTYENIWLGALRM